MKRLIIAAVVFVIVIAGLSWYFFRDDTIVIGVVAEHSSSSSSANADSYDGAELAFSELNATGADYVLKRLDLAEMTQPEELLSALDAEEIDVVIGPVTSSQFYPFKEALQSCGRPVFLNSVSSTVISDQQDNLFRLTDDINAYSMNLEAAVFEQFAAEEMTIFYTTKNKDYTFLIASETKDKFELHGVKTNLIEMGNTDDKATQKMLKQPFDGEVFLIIAGPGDAGVYAQLLSIANPDVPFLFTAWSMDDRLKDYTRSLTNDIYIAASPEPIYTENHQSFQASLEHHYNKTANNFLTYGYEVAYFVDHVLEQTDALEVEAIQSYVHGLTLYRGRFNDFYFDDTGDGGRGYALYRVTDSDFQVVIPYLKEVTEYEH